LPGGVGLPPSTASLPERIWEWINPREATKATRKKELVEQIIPKDGRSRIIHVATDAGWFGDFLCTCEVVCGGLAIR
jgi:hypothetical protein